MGVNHVTKVSIVVESTTKQLVSTVQQVTPVKHKAVDCACHVSRARTNLKQRSKIVRNVQPIPTRQKQSKRPARTALTTSIPIQVKRFVKNVKLEKKLLGASVEHFTVFSANQVEKIQCQVFHVQTAVLDPTIIQTIHSAMVVSLENGAMLKD